MDLEPIKIALFAGLMPATQHVGNIALGLKHMPSLLKIAAKPMDFSTFSPKVATWVN
jgi:hypothetical protein